MFAVWLIIVVVKAIDPYHLWVSGLDFDVLHFAHAKYDSANIET